MPKSRKHCQLEETLRIFRGRVKWFHGMLMWALNHCQDTPAPLLLLVREKAMELLLEQNDEERKP